MKLKQIFLESEFANGQGNMFFSMLNNRLYHFKYSFLC